MFKKEIYGNHFDLGVDNKGLVHTVANDTDDAIQFKSLEQLDLFILGLMEYRKVFTEGYGDFLEKEIEVLDDVEDKWY